MNIDLTNLITGITEELIIDNFFEIPKERLKNTVIKDLKNLKFKGSINKLYDDSYEITGTINGIMILPDDITLELIDYEFETEIEEKFSEFDKLEEKSLEIVKNSLDITEFLWQNILVEIPLKIKSEKSEKLNLKGEGWRFITEEDLNNQKSNNSPFSELYNLIDSRKE